MCDIRSYFLSSPIGAAATAGAAATGAAAAALRPLSVLSWNARSLRHRNADGELQRYLTERQRKGLLIMPEIVCLQETWYNFATGSANHPPKEDLRQLLHNPVRAPPHSENGGDSLGLDELPPDSETAVNVLGSLDRSRQRLLPDEWAAALTYGFWSCCAAKQSAGTGAPCAVTRPSTLRRFFRMSCVRCLQNFGTTG
eukprot:SAG31_NODE_1207_length_9383_cov_5.316351_3_plen_198_part_00